MSSLFAAFNIADGTVISQIHRRHRAVEFKKFLIAIDKAVPAELDVHLVCDNLATHKTPAVNDWLTKHPRVHIHFTPIGDPAGFLGAGAPPNPNTKQQVNRTQRAGTTNVSQVSRPAPGGRTVVREASAVVTCCARAGRGGIIIGVRRGCPRKDLGALSL